MKILKIILSLWISIAILFFVYLFFSQLNEKNWLIVFPMSSIESIATDDIKQSFPISDFSAKKISLVYHFKEEKVLDKMILEINTKNTDIDYNIEKKICFYEKCQIEYYNLTLINKIDTKSTFFINKVPSKEMIMSDFTDIFYKLKIVWKNNTHITQDDINEFIIFKNDRLLFYHYFLKQLNSIDFETWYIIIAVFCAILFFVLEYKDTIEKRFLYFYILWVIITVILAYIQLYASWFFILYDEYYTRTTILQSYTQIITSTAGDVHPPWYYFFLKTLSFIFWNDIIVLKILNIFLIFPIFYFLYKLYTEIFQKNFHHILLLIVYFSSLNIYFLVFSSIIRMYLLGILVFLISSYYFVLFLKNTHQRKIQKTYIFLYIIFATFSLYIHNYFLFITASHFFYGVLYLYKTKNLKRNIMKILMIFWMIWLLYSPWLGILIQQSQNVTQSYWIENIQLSDIAQFILNIHFYTINDVFWKNIFDNIVLLTIPIIALFLYTIIRFYSIHKNNILALYILFISIFTTIIVIMYSLLKTPIFSERYFLFLFFFYITFCFSLSKKFVIVLFFIWAITCYYQIGINYLDPYWDYKNMDKKILHIIQNEKPEIIINKSIMTAVVIKYLQEKQNIKVINTMYVDDTKTRKNAAYNWWSLFHNFYIQDKNTLQTIQNKKILILNYWEEWENVYTPIYWNKIKDEKNKFKYSILENKK